MKKKLSFIVVTILFLALIGAYAQPTFTSLSINPTNTQATITFSAAVSGSSTADQDLASNEFSVSVTASSQGGSVAAGPVTAVVSHTAPSETVTLSFTIPNASTADGSEVLTISPSGSDKIFDATGAMASGASISANLNDLNAPTLSSIDLTHNAITNSNTVNFAVTFNESVQANTVTSDDFSIFSIGLTGASIGTISPSSGSATVFNVTVNTGSGDGTIELDWLGGSSVTDVAGNVGTFTLVAGQVYTIDKTPPSVSNIDNFITTIYSGSLTQTVTITYSEPMNTAVVPIVTIDGGGTNWGAQTNVGGTNGWSGNVYTATFTHNGTPETSASITTSVSAGNAQDLAGNLNTGSVTSSAFKLDTQKPNVSSIALSTTSPTNASSVNFTVTFSEPVQATSIASNDFTLAVTSITGSSIGTISPSSGNATTYTVIVNTGSGDGTLGLNWVASGNATDANGNIGTGQTFAGQVYTIDKTVPVLNSITINSPLKGIGTTNGIAASSVSFQVTFTENNPPLTGIDPTDFTVLVDGSVTYTTPLVIAGSGTTRIVTINGITGTGRISLGLLDDNSIQDAALNPLAGALNGGKPAAFTGSQYYTIVLPEPSESVTSFTSSATSNSVTITWNDAVSPTTQATHYFVRIKKSTVNFTIPVFADFTDDGADYTDTDFGDGTLGTYVAYESTLPTGTITFSGISSGTVYNVEIYPLTYTIYYPSPSSNNWDYRFSSPLIGNVTTTTAANGNITAVEASPFVSSLETTLSGATAPQVNAVNYFRFTIKDDGTNDNSDDADFKFSTIVIKEGTRNNISDWTQVIGSAELSDGVNTPISVTTSSITTSPNTITFVVDPSTVGFIADNAFKTYTLRIALKNPLEGTLPSTIDGKNFEFRIDQTSFTYSQTNNQASSTLSAISRESGNTNLKIDVTATRLDFTSQPDNLIAGVRQPFSQLVVMARDANNLVDLDYDGTEATLSSPAGLSLSTYLFSKGVLTLPVAFISSSSRSLSGLYYISTGDGTITVTANGISSNTGGSIPCLPIQVMNVRATINNAGAPITNNLKGGTNNVVIFGVTFTADNNSNSEPSLKKFTFTFDTPYKTQSRTILQNFRVRDEAGTSVTQQGATVTPISSTGDKLNFDLVTVDWGTNPPPSLFDANSGNPSPKSYYLVCDISVTADISTPRLTPQLIAGGYGSSTEANFVVSQGSASANVIGTQYQFASTRPPTLLTTKGSGTSPYNSQLNVSPNISEIALAFDVAVWSLDGKIELYKKSNDERIAVLEAINGNYSNDKTVAPANPLRFSIPQNVVPLLQADSLYYIKIAKGSYNNANNIGTGIADNSLNFFGGITYNNTLYFKISSPNAPVLTEINGTFFNNVTGSFSVKFDQQGTGYFLVLDPTKYSTPPENMDIYNPSEFLIRNPGSVISYDSFLISKVDIGKVNTAQFVTSQGSFTPNKTYDIWVYAKNDATPAIATLKPYGNASNSHRAGSIGPTLKITTPKLPTLINKPTYQLCPNSEMLLTEPIILTENVANDFYLSGNQELNILLPTGFQFLSTPKVTLYGSDFDQSSLSVTLVNNTIATISYLNQGTSSVDNIVISDLFVKSASGNLTGNIIPFAGNAKLRTNARINSLDKLASISTLDLGTPNFSNSFSRDNNFTAFGFNKMDVIAAIPDNYADKDVSINGFIRLIPKLEDVNDYGTTTFSGTAVSNDLLSLASAPLNAAFNITITHADINGCLSTASNQYYVYDHSFPISKNLGRDENNIPIGTKQALINPNFPGKSVDVEFPNATLSRLNYDNLAGYRLVDLYADLPADASGQIMDKDWRSLVKQIPVKVDSITIDENKYRSFRWDYLKIINQISEEANKSTKLLDSLKKGGSLGKVQFIGRYQSTADLSVYIPLKQEVELFFAPVPIIDTTNASQSAKANNVSIYCEQGVVPSTSGASPITFKGYPAALVGTSVGSFFLENASDNLIFCANNLNIPTTGVSTSSNNKTRITLTKPINLKPGNNVTVFGYTNTGTNISNTASVVAISSDFREVTLSTNFNANNTITNISVTLRVNGFVDNSNGTLTLRPDLLREALKSNSANNGYQNIHLGYTYKENDSPISGTGYITIRIAPNPTVSFNAVSQPSENVDALINTAYCENRPIEFTSVPQIASIAGTTNTVDKFSWDFGDPVNSTTTNPNIIPNAFRGTLLGTSSKNIGVAEKPIHSYSTFASYIATHIVTSNYGCQSRPDTTTLTVGAIPTVTYEFAGVSTGSNFSFKLTNDLTKEKYGVKQLLWDFGDGEVKNKSTSFQAVEPHIYKTPGVYLVSAKLTSTIGCINTVSAQKLLVLPFVVGSKKFDFETNQQWFDIGATGAVSSWAQGTPVAGATPAFPLEPKNGKGIWKTNLGGTYTSGEQSYLFSPVFDISKISKPMVSFDCYYDFNAQDGVVLQFSTDNYNIVDSRKTWYTLGTYDALTPSGYNWFTDQGLSSKPGRQLVGDYGWSGQSKAWKDSRHSLNYQITGLDNTGKPVSITPAKSEQLVFRFALASTKDVNVTRNGFAIDNFAVAERTRLVVVESFSNLGNPDNEKEESNTLKDLTQLTAETGAFANGDILNINYHVGFPYKDPFNLDNPDDPSARALFYNISTSPRSRVDGADGSSATSSNHLFSTWKNYFKLQQLKLPSASIDLTGTKTTADGSINVLIKAKALEDLDTLSVLHVGILEKSIAFTNLTTSAQSLINATNKDLGNSEFVLKKMLPNAAGTKFSKALKVNDTKDWAFSWTPDPAKLYGIKTNTDSLYVFAFIQNYRTREIYQSAVFAVNLDYGNKVVTGMGKLTAEEIAIFPNPTNKEFTIELPNVTNEKIDYQVFDQLGKVIHNGSLYEGQRSKAINSEAFSTGIYIIQLNSTTDRVIRKKIMIINE